MDAPPVWSRVLVLIALGVLEANFGDMPFLHAITGAYLLLGMIVIPGLVFTGYFLVVCALAIYALVKVLRTNWRLRA
jgi:hypothetical protein